MTEKTVSEAVKDLKSLPKILGTEEYKHTFSCGKTVILKPATLRTASLFQQEFGADRVPINGESDQGVQLKLDEFMWLLFNLQKEPVWNSIEEMSEDIAMGELVDLQDVLYSFFLGLDVLKMP